MENATVKPAENEHLKRGGALAAATGMAALGAAVGYFDPAKAGLFPVCPLLAMTGFACPGCGATRGLHALLHGDLLGALDFNLLLPGFLIFFGYLFVSLLLTALRGRGLDFRIFTPRVIGGFFVFALVFTVARNLPLYPFNLLYP